MFDTILIANRGEIACRIIKTARTMGIRTIAIYSSVDKQNLHVAQADEAYCVGEASSKESYLNIRAILEIAQKHKVKAIHPGYGFLSENPDFAKACRQADIVFIGPSVEAMEAMASKQVAKQLLEKTGVPLTPGYHGLNQDPEFLLEQAKTIGFPVLLKAASGGGGKGMRSVLSEKEFHDALQGAKREALASFADDTMIIEKLVQNPRHVEVQIMADQHGQVLSLFERDCSIQRRHQKIIEEAPAPHLSDSLRSELAKAAREVAQSIAYEGAGTIEFLVDADENFYFMEMNTRLQVEHPVTEMITGLDLVALQIKVAAGQPLEINQDQLQAHGHAIECRIYAEDPFQEFIPSIGQIEFLKAPQGDGIRIDTGVVQGSQISQFYDPMIAKLIVWGETREEAIVRSQCALSQYAIRGVKTNLPFLQAIFKNPAFQKAALSTNFLAKEKITPLQASKELGFLMAASFDYLQIQQQLSDSLWKESFAWQSQNKTHWVSRYEEEEFQIFPVDAKTLIIAQCSAAEKTQWSVVTNFKKNILTITVDGIHYKALVENQKNHIHFYTTQGLISINRFSWNKKSTSNNAQGQLKAPMPSTVVAILKKVGDTVKTGDALIVLEAMKMEHTLHAPKEGVLQEIFYTVGAQVNEGEELLTLSNEQGS